MGYPPWMHWSQRCWERPWRGSKWVGNLWYNVLFFHWSQLHWPLSLHWLIFSTHSPISPLDTSLGVDFWLWYLNKPFKYRCLVKKNDHVRSTCLRATKNWLCNHFRHTSPFDIKTLMIEIYHTWLPLVRRGLYVVWIAYWYWNRYCWVILNELQQINEMEISIETNHETQIWSFTTIVDEIHMYYYYYYSY